ncbi:MAG: hypothetical protein QM778_31335 [Myxococcales bacterium]
MMPSRHSLVFLLAALGGSLVAGCSADQSRDVSGIQEDAGLSGDFVAETETSLVLAPGSSQDLTVRYAGGPAEGNQVEFAVVPADEVYPSDKTLGADADAGATAPPGGSLSASSVFTNPNGEATTRLTVGSTPGTFRVRARLASFEPVYFQITVSADLFPKLMVDVQYEGLRAITTRSATAIAGLSCDQAMKVDKSGAEVQSSDDEDPSVLSFSLVPGQKYAVVAWGRDGTYAELATGCTSYTATEVTTKADGTPQAPDTLSVLLEDKPMRLNGNYPVEIALKVDESMARLAGSAQKSVAALLPAGANAEASAYLDVVHDVLVAQGKNTEADKLQTRDRQQGREPVHVVEQRAHHEQGRLCDFGHGALDVAHQYRQEHGGARRLRRGHHERIDDVQRGGPGGALGRRQAGLRSDEHLRQHGAGGHHHGRVRRRARRGGREDPGDRARARRLRTFAARSARQGRPEQVVRLALQHGGRLFRRVQLAAERCQHEGRGGCAVQPGLRQQRVS